MKKTNKLLKYLPILVTFFIYSLSGVFAKLASDHKLLSANFIIFYGISLFILFIYAILWQQVLKRFPLSTAYVGKAMTIILGMVWGVFLFKERITWNMILGSIIIIIGLIGMVSANE